MQFDKVVSVSNSDVTSILMENESIELTRLKVIGIFQISSCPVEKNACLSGKNYTYPVDLSDCVLQTAGVAAAQGTKQNRLSRFFNLNILTETKQQREESNLILKPLYWPA